MYSCLVLPPWRILVNIFLIITLLEFAMQRKNSVDRTDTAKIEAFGGRTRTEVSPII